MMEVSVQHTLVNTVAASAEWDRRFSALADSCLAVGALVSRLVDSAKKEAVSWGAARIESIENELSLAAAACGRARVVAQEKLALRDALDKLIAEAPRGSWLVCLLMFPLAILAIVSEALLNTPLPWALGFKGLMEICLMIGPAFLLPIALERISSPLLAATSKFGRVARGVFMAFVAILILSTVAMIGIIRGTVGAIRGGADVDPRQLQIVDTTLLVLGICVCLCAVIVSFTAGQELSRAVHHLVLNRRLNKARLGLEEARQEEVRAVAQLESAKRQHDRREQLARQYENEFLAARMEALDGRLAKIQTGTPTTTMLELKEKIAVWNAFELGWGVATDPQIGLVPTVMPGAREVDDEVAA